ncbi:MAG: TIGR04013 family B12-binding domain/radical SAM domain-containing protein [Methanotrichaceae archaeon]
MSKLDRMKYLKSSPNHIWFRWNKKNRYSIAALLPLVKGAGLTDEPKPGIMLYSFATAQAEEIYREVSRSEVDAIYVAGGPHPSAKPEETLKYFDYVAIGEGEETLPELIKMIKEERDPDAVTGIAYKKDGNVRFTAKRKYVNLNLYPPFQPPLFAPIEMSRGCPWGCAYCQTPYLCGRRMRHRSISMIVKYAQHYSDLRFTSPNSLAYGSDGRVPRLDKVERLLNTLSDLKKPIYFGTFPSEVRPDFVSEDALDLIVKYCVNRTLSIGGQSGSETVLKKIGRGHGVETIERACEICLDRGIIPNVDLIIGLPMETADDQINTLSLARNIVKKGGTIRSHYFMPLPSTPLENANPAPVDEEVTKSMGRLAQEGKVSGRWSPLNQM